MKTKIATADMDIATEYYALAFQGGFSRDLFDNDSVMVKIKHAIAAVSIGGLTDNQFTAFLDTYKDGNYSLSHSEKHLIAFIPKEAILVGSVEEYRMRVLLETKCEKKTDPRQQALDAAVFLAYLIRGEECPKKYEPVYEPSDTTSAPDKALKEFTGAEELATSSSDGFAKRSEEALDILGNPSLSVAEKAKAAFAVLSGNTAKESIVNPLVNELAPSDCTSVNIGIDIADQVEKMDGRWVEPKEFLNENINKQSRKFTSRKLQHAKAKGNVVLSKKNPAIGKGSNGVFFERTGGDNKWNYRYRYFLCRENDLTIATK